PLHRAHPSARASGEPVLSLRPMRVVSYAVLLVCLAVGFAGAQPKKLQPTKAQTDELAKLDKELIDHQTKQAYLAAAKTARKLYELQRKATGDDSIEAERRKQ